MELLLNDLSFHGQFQNAAEAGDALGRLMRIREIAKRFGRDLYCYRAMSYAPMTPSHTLPQVISGLERDARSVLMSWITRGGPFWLDERTHTSDDVLVYGDDDIATDSALGEAGYCQHIGVDRRLVSVSPSDWERTPLAVDLFTDNGDRHPIRVPNYWSEAAVEADLLAAPLPLRSWNDLAGLFLGPTSRCPHVTFSADAFTPLDGHPFVPGAAERIVVLLDTLEALRRCGGDDGGWTTEGHRLLAEHFSGAKGWFTRSSSTEENDFRTELTFPDPAKPGESLFCSWHGKVKIGQIRIHLSDPTPPPTPLRVVYVGPKLTKR